MYYFCIIFFFVIKINLYIVTSEFKKIIVMIKPKHKCVSLSTIYMLR